MDADEAYELSAVIEEALGERTYVAKMGWAVKFSHDERTVRIESWSEWETYRSTHDMPHVMPAEDDTP
jgi:hypothetical protein